MKRIALILLTVLLLTGCTQVNKYQDGAVTCYYTTAFPLSFVPGGIDCQP